MIYVVLYTVTITAPDQTSCDVFAQGLADTLRDASYQQGAREQPGVVNVRQWRLKKEPDEVDPHA